jgi:hypothetical protein
MKNKIENYVFDKDAKTITFTSYSNIKLESVLAVINQTAGITIYEAANVLKGGVVSTNVLTLTFDTTTMNDDDELYILYHDSDIVDGDPLELIRPAILGGKAVDVTTYAPAYSPGDAVSAAFDKNTGALIVAQGNLDPALDISRAIASSTSNISYTGLSYFRSLLVNTSFQNIKSSAGNIYGIRIINKDASLIYVKFYNKTGGLSSDTPIFTIAVPAGIGSFIGIDYHIGRAFGTALSVRCVTGVAENDATSPGTAPIIEVDYN